MKQKVFFILISVILTGCQKTIKSGELVEIDISKSYPKKEIHLQDVADIEYIPLETTDDILLGQISIISYISDNYIVVYDYMQAKVFVFNRDGTIASHFSHKGQGDKEYSYIMDLVFDEKNEEIFVMDNPSTHRIQVYSLNGEFIRSLKYADDLRISVFNFDDETLLVYDENGLMQNEYREVPYMFMSKKDGSIVSELDIRLSVRYASSKMMSVEVNGQTGIAPFNIRLSNNRFYGRDFVIADMSSDTIYRLTKTKELTPMLVRTPSVHSSDPRTVWVVELVTDRFIFISKATLDFELVRKTQQVSMLSFCHEFETGEISDMKFVNDDYPSGRDYTNAIDTPSKNVAVGLIQLPTLKSAYEEKKLKGELEKLVATLDEEDNPVVMIVKFK